MKCSYHLITIIVICFREVNKGKLFTLDSKYARFEENPGDRSFESNVLCLSLLNPKSFEWLPGFLY